MNKKTHIHLYTHTLKFVTRKKNNRNEKTHIFYAYLYLKIYNYKKEPYESKHYRNKYIYTQNYELKCTIKYITVVYISELLKLLIF